MAPIALIFGALLIALGLVGYLDHQLLGESQKQSPTALIPAFFGAIIFLCGLITLLAPGARKHAMHLASLVGVIGIIGGFMPLFRSKFDFQKASAVSGVLMIGLCFLFVLMCIRSFIAIRRARRQAPPA